MHFQDSLVEGEHAPLEAGFGGPGALMVPGRHGRLRAPVLVSCCRPG